MKPPSEDHDNEDIAAMILRIIAGLTVVVACYVFAVRPFFEPIPQRPVAQDTEQLQLR